HVYRPACRGGRQYDSDCAEDRKNRTHSDVGRGANGHRTAVTHCSEFKLSFGPAFICAASRLCCELTLLVNIVQRLEFPACLGQREGINPYLLARSVITADGEFPGPRGVCFRLGISKAFRRIRLAVEYLAITREKLRFGFHRGLAIRHLDRKLGHR